MITPEQVIITAFTILGLALILQVVVLKTRGLQVLGKITFNRFFFTAAKISMVANWTLFLLVAFRPELRHMVVPEYLMWAAAGLTCVGSLLMILSFFALGRSLKVAIPTEETRLQTTGIFSLSRNPLYSGVFLITLASCLFFPHIINILFAVLTILIHHFIILEEEDFLERRFGKEYTDYKKKVRRYV